MVSLADVERCKAEHHTGRRCGSIDIPTEHIGSVEVFREAVPFLRAEGLRALRRVLRMIVLHYSAKGKCGVDGSLTKILGDAYASCADPEQARREHEQRFEKRSTNSIARGLSGSIRRDRLTRLALKRGTKPPRTYRHDVGANDAKHSRMSAEERRGAIAIDAAAIDRDMAAIRMLRRKRHTV